MQRASHWRQRNLTLYSLVLPRTYPLQATAVLLGLALPALAVYPLHLKQRVIDDAVPVGDTTLLGELALLYAATILLHSAIKFAVVYLRGWIAAIVTRSVRGALIDAQRRRDRSHASGKIGAVTSVIAAEVEPLGDFSAEAIITPVMQGGTLIAVLGYMTATDARLALIGVAALALQATLTPILQRRINRLTVESIRATRRASADMIEAVEPTRHAHIAGALGEIRFIYGTRMRMSLLKSALKTLRNLIDQAANLAVLAFGALLVIRGETELGVVVAFLAGLRDIRGPWGELVNFYRRLADASVKFELVRAAMTNSGSSGPVLAPRAPAPSEA